MHNNINTGRVTIGTPIHANKNDSYVAELDYVATENKINQPKAPSPMPRRSKATV